MKDTLRYRLAVVFEENNNEYKEFLQKQIDELNKKMSSENHEIEVVEITKDNLSNKLLDGAINGVVYFSDMHEEISDYENTLQELIKLQNGLDVYPVNHKREDNQKQDEFSKQEETYIKSLNSTANVFPAIKVNNENEMKAATNVMNIGIETTLTAMDEAYIDVNTKSNNLRDYVIGATSGKHEYTAGHVDRVSKYAVAIAENMGYKDKKLEQLSLSAALHDIGKLGIQDDILASNRILTNEERAEMEYHTVLGPEILKNAVRNDPELGEIITKDVIEGVGQHHNDWNGGEHDDINEFALIICVADCLDTMTSQRAYNSPKNILNVMRDLWRNRDKMFREDIAETGLVVLSKQLAQIGIDSSKLFKENGRDAELQQFLQKSMEKIAVNQTKEYCDLDFKLDEKGHFEFENGPKYDENKSKQNDIGFNEGNIIKNKYGKQTKFENLTQEEKQSITEEATKIVETRFMEDETEMKEAFERSKSKDTKINIVGQIKEATKKDARINFSGVKESIHVVKDTIREKQNVKDNINQERDL